MIEKYLLVKRGFYWRPDSEGYTAFKHDAGRYSEGDALSRSRGSMGKGDLPVNMILEKIAPELAPGICGFEALAYLEKANTKKQLIQYQALLQHMLGAGSNYQKNEWGFRNHFVSSHGTTDDVALQQMTSIGLVVRGSSPLASDSNVYTATKLGAEVIGFKPYQLRKVSFPLPRMLEGQHATA